MMRSMFSGVTGLRAHQTRMDVVGNNVANVNTVGFKASRVTFQEVFSQTMQGASAPDAASGRGGINPMQVGLGIGVSAIDTIMTRGSMERTDNPTDLSIDGEGFFVVKGEGAASYMFTRAGNFGIDKLGNLVNANGLNVHGWQEFERKTDGTYYFDTEKDIGPINLFSDAANNDKRMIPARETTMTHLAGNLNASHPALGTGNDTAENVQFTAPVTVYDALGNSYTINIQFWKMEATGGEDGQTTWQWGIDGGGATTGATGEITFDSKGKIIQDDQNIADVILTPDSEVGAKDMEIKIDFTQLTMFSADSTARPTLVDGHSTGDLVTFGIGADGVITGIYSNGRQQPLGLVALATFENPAGLQKVGQNMYLPTTNSGDFLKAVRPGAEGAGTLNPGTLEMSNVDLSKEFTNMIITQRGFQANSRIITTSDEMLQELVNLKR